MELHYNTPLRHYVHYCHIFKKVASPQNNTNAETLISFQQHTSGSSVTLQFIMITATTPHNELWNYSL